MEAKLLLIPWMVSVLYGSIPLFWFAIHPFADSWRKMRRSPYVALLPLWTAILCALGWITWPWHGLEVYSTPWLRVAALIFFIPGVLAYRRIFSEFGARKLSGEAELRPAEREQALVTTGLHARMHHPIYIAHLCMLAAWTLLGGLLVSLVLLAASVLLTFPLMIWLEERELERRFGQSFREYKRAVPLIPRIWPDGEPA